MAVKKILHYNQNKDKKIEVTCGDCRKSTKHIVLTDVLLRGCEEINEHISFDWNNEYQIIQCLGCETIAFRKTHQNSEDFDYDGHTSLYEDIYPNPDDKREPIAEEHLLPASLRLIYMETLKAVNSDQPILAGIGIRALVETICKNKSAKGVNLKDKIDDLVSIGVLTRDGANILHKLRSLGNTAAHEVKPHKPQQLWLSLDVIDHLLTGVYILPLHASSKFD